MLKTFLISFFLVCVGNGLNYLAKRCNDGKMPVWIPSRFTDAEEVKRWNKHSVLTKKTRVKILCDVIPVLIVHKNRVLLAAASVGDIFQVGALVFFALAAWPF